MASAENPVRAALNRLARLAATPVPMLGHVTSWCFSPHVDAWIGRALVAGGRARHGDTLWAVSPLANATVQVKIGPPVFVDAAGERLRG